MERNASEFRNKYSVLTYMLNIYPGDMLSRFTTFQENLEDPRYYMHSDISNRF